MENTPGMPGDVALVGVASVGTWQRELLSNSGGTAL